MNSDPLIADRYQLVRHLDDGGMGSVWLAEDHLLRRKVALKQLLPRLGSADLAERRRRAMTEAKALAQVNHVAIVPIYDVLLVGKDPWIVMEYIEGRSLNDFVREGGLTERAIAKIALSVLQALCAAHDKGVIHRDVKPANILISDTDKSVFLIDFGIAKINGDISITRYNAAIGTIDYIAPERLAGNAATRESDLWSLGVTLFFALEGYSPFLRKGAADRETTAWAIMNAGTPRLRYQGRLAEIVVRMLAKDPSRRPSADQVARVLLAVTDGHARMRPEPPRSQAPQAQAQAQAPRITRQPREPEPRPVEARLSATALHDARDAVRRAGSPESGTAMLLAMPERNAAEVLAGLRSREAGKLIQAIGAGKPATAGRILKILATNEASHAVDFVGTEVAASIVSAMPVREAALILGRANPRTSAEIIMELPLDAALRLVKAMQSKQATGVLGFVWPTTVAALVRESEELKVILDDLAPPFRTQVLRHL